MSRPSSRGRDVERRRRKSRASLSRQQSLEDFPLPPTATRSRSSSTALRGAKSTPDLDQSFRCPPVSYTTPISLDSQERTPRERSLTPAPRISLSLTPSPALETSSPLEQTIRELAQLLQEDVLALSPILPAFDHDALFSAHLFSSDQDGEIRGRQSPEQQLAAAHATRSTTHSTQAGARDQGAARDHAAPREGHKRHQHIRGRAAPTQILTIDPTGFDFGFAESTSPTTPATTAHAGKEDMAWSPQPLPPPHPPRREDLVSPPARAISHADEDGEQSASIAGAKPVAQPPPAPRCSRSKSWRLTPCCRASQAQQRSREASESPSQAPSKSASQSSLQLRQQQQSPLTSPPTSPLASPDMMKNEAMCVGLEEVALVPHGERLSRGVRERERGKEGERERGGWWWMGCGSCLGARRRDDGGDEEKRGRQGGR